MATAKGEERTKLRSIHWPEKLPASWLPGLFAKGDLAIVFLKGAGKLDA